MFLYNPELRRSACSFFRNGKIWGSRSRAYKEGCPSGSDNDEAGSEHGLSAMAVCPSKKKRKKRFGMLGFSKRVKRLIACNILEDLIQFRSRRMNELAPQLPLNERLEKLHRKVKRTLWTSRTSERLSIVMIMVPVSLAGCCPEKIVKEKVSKVGAPSEFPPLLQKIVCVPNLRMVLGPWARYIRTTKCTILLCLCTIWTKTKCRSPHLRFLP